MINAARIPDTLALAILAGVALSPVTSTFAQGAGPSPERCTADGIDWAKSAVYARARHFSDAGREPRAPVICTVTRVVEAKLGQTLLRLTEGRLNMEKADGVQLPVRLIDVARMEADGPRSLARLLLDGDPVNRAEIFEPQFNNADGTILVRLAPRHDWIFAVTGNTVTAVPAFDWQEQVRATLPADQRHGRVLSIDVERMEGRLALRRSGTNPAEPLPSAFEDSRMAVAKLAFRNGKLEVDSTTIAARKPDDELLFAEFADSEEDIRKKAGKLPPRVEPCALGGWSNDTDRKGLNVRAAPNAAAPVLGIVPPPRRDRQTENEFGPDPIKAEFTVLGFRDGWFLIGEITAPGVAYGVAYPRKAPKPYKGQGWVHARLVGGALANGGLPTGQLHVSPHADSATLEVRDEDGNPIGLDGTPFTLLACSGRWGLVEFKGGKRGWWRSICSNQVTNCS
ncbi:MAG: hypothetical protein O9322_02905 [Beijerinckiaceae bacterium]|nr:hypothetical protein [Beijerinckiaceae bacterium]MCZ8301514.1 hypothetical protein [Beijerinckiaceae bacterium]